MASQLSVAGYTIASQFDIRNDRMTNLTQYGPLCRRLSGNWEIVLDNAFTTDIDGQNHIATITLARPDDGNRLTAENISQLGTAIASAACDPKMLLVVVRARGEAFCLGRIPGKQSKTAPSAMEISNRVTRPILKLYADIREAEIPVMAIVQGEARGFGCAMVSQCDLAIASTQAVFSMPEMDNNLPPTLAISSVLHRLPPKQIARLVYSRCRVSAQEALASGIVGELAEPDTLETAAADLIARITDRRRASLVTIKSYMRTAPYMDPRAYSLLADNMLSVVLSSDDGR
ncbi:enoyl-CoA hydratase/isomerase family protein [Hoeflea sp. CAU 1731]